MGEAGLELVIADLVIAGVALGAGATAADEGHGDTVALFPIAHVPANGLDNSRQFVAGHMGKPDVGIMTHPAVPIAAAYARGHDPNNNPVRLRNRIGNLHNFWGDREGFVKHGFHCELPLQKLIAAESKAFPKPDGLFDASLSRSVKPKHYKSLDILSIS